MILFLLLVASSLLAGIFASIKLGFKKLHETIGASIAFSSLFIIITNFFFYAVLGTISNTSIIFSTITCTLIATVLKQKIKVTRTKLIFAIFILVTLSPAFLLNKDILRIDDSQNILTTGDAWSDNGLHVSIIQYFVEERGFPPVFPQKQGAPMTYPFIADFLTAVYIKAGLSIHDATAFQNIILTLSLAALIFTLAAQFCSKWTSTAIAGVTFFFNGNLGSLSALSELVSGSFTLTKDYGHLEQYGLHFENLYEHFLYSQRSILLGLCLSVVVYILLYRQFKTINKRELLVAGCITGLMPIIHFHSFLSIMFVAAFSFVFKPKKEWAYFFLPVALLATPQALWIKQSTDGALQLLPGWPLDLVGGDISAIGWFWINNTAFLIPLTIIGLWKSNKKEIMFYLPFVALFIVFNLIRIQAGAGDNNKYFLHWILASALFVGKAVEKQKIPVKLILLVAVFLSTFSGVLSAANGWSTSYALYGNSQVNAANWIKQNTDKNAVFLTDRSNTNPVDLSGRQKVLGSWWWTENIFQTEKGVKEDVEHAVQTGECTTLNKYNVSFILIEKGNQEFNQQAFENQNYSVAYENNRIIIYKSQCEK